jgi:hypothetical protein
LGAAAFEVRLLRLDKKIGSSMPMSLRRVANIVKPAEFCDWFSTYGDKTLTLFADGQAVEVPVF